MSVNVVSNLQIQVAIYGFMATIAKMPYGIIKYAKIYANTLVVGG
jgi:hypothetical protein